jgi:hypothetical protein
MGDEKMRATLMLGILCTALATVSGAAAQPWGMSPAERAGYDAGVDAAVEFCQDLRARERIGWGARSVTRQFERGCKRGFNDHIDSNRTCQARIEEQDAYIEMRDARRFACS